MTKMEAAARAGERHFERFALNQRIQHVLLMASFFVLVITGFPVRYAGVPVSSEVIGFLGGFTARGIIHRAAAIVLIGLTVYHMFYVMHSKVGHSDFLALIPNKKDIRDVINMLKFYFGLTSDRPKFDRFNFVEKLEYASVAWGSVIMIGTGAVLWFEEQAMLILPKWTLDIANVVHSYEALLAFLAIIVWHFYHVHLNPEAFPMSRVWLTGKMSETEMREQHPLEYERLTNQRPDTIERVRPKAEAEK